MSNEKIIDLGARRRLLTEPELPGVDPVTEFSPLYDQTPRIGRHIGTRGDRVPQMLVLGFHGAWNNETKLAKHLQETPRFGADWAVGRSGVHLQLLPAEAVAIHSPGGVDWEGRGQVNLRSVSFLLCNRGGVREATATSPQFRRRAPAGWLQAIHPKNGRLRWWERYGTKQLDGLRTLVLAIAASNESLLFVCGREDLVRSAVDPGPAFPWSAIDWDELGVERMERDWKTGGWYWWRAGKRKPYRRKNDRGR